MDHLLTSSAPPLPMFMGQFFLSIPGESAPSPASIIFNPKQTVLGELASFYLLGGKEYIVCFLPYKVQYQV